MTPPVPIRLNLFPGGLSRALTLSYDDGVAEDRRFVSILNAHGLKGTFHINSGTIGHGDKIAREEIAPLYKGHEVAAHSVTHPHLAALPPAERTWEILEDRRALEALVGYPVRGMSYPFGSHSPEVVAALAAAGIEYCRTVASHGGFHAPEQPLLWHPTLHHNHDLEKKADEFFSPVRNGDARLLYVWGHTYEFERTGTWDLIERFAERIGTRAAKEKDVWLATNIEVHDYLAALRSLRASADGRIVRNLSALPVWITWNREPREIPAGATAAL
ncbi:MAG TPA: polysaccharide deacetylase family protein [Candidatus Methylacidiphilales bacterium]